ncbi:hypothetical protein [Ruegeria lacuscaerulensis]|uniref:hypothetical protein n=1 Tax=Ruegeria lacuscaerulensis TaxID=55218 RepID=UPI00147C27C7|nr:hypothetical protein [Ruegeria lacuscaerulensis]
MTVSYTRKVGANNNRARLWLEGRHLDAAGLSHGITWSLLRTETGLIIQAEPDGKRRIAGNP